MNSEVCKIELSDPALAAGFLAANPPASTLICGFVSCKSRRNQGSSILREVGCNSAKRLKKTGSSIGSSLWFPKTLMTAWLSFSRWPVTRSCLGQQWNISSFRSTSWSSRRGKKVPLPPSLCLFSTLPPFWLWAYWRTPIRCQVVSQGDRKGQTKEENHSLFAFVMTQLNVFYNFWVSQAKDKTKQVPGYICTDLSLSSELIKRTAFISLDC